MTEKIEQASLFEEETTKGPVTCLGLTFNNDDERREYFREELRKKLPKLKEIQGFPNGEDEEIIYLSDPPYFTLCPNPWIDDIIFEWNRNRTTIQDNEYKREPFATDVSEGKGDGVYNAHNYHTKVPYKAIMRYLLHYTSPGDIILDGFSGTGMTGVAAKMCADKKIIKELGIDENEIEIGERKVVLNDLSPIATNISYNYNNNFNAKSFKIQAYDILDEIEKECGWMFETIHDTLANTKGKVNYTVWSDVFICPNCSNEIIFSKVAFDNITKQVKKEFECPKCTSLLTKKKLSRAIETFHDPKLNLTIQQTKRIPVLINYKYGGNIFEKKPDENDFKLIDQINDMDIPYWYPDNELIKGDKTVEPIRLGITNVHHFYSNRALYVLAKTFNLLKEADPSLKSFLYFTFEQAVLGLSKLARYVPTHFSQVNQYLSGTLYIGSQIVDPSLDYVVKNKIDRLYKLLKDRNYLSKTLITTQSMDSLNQIKHNSIDYIFTDPPFGANLMYSELNFLWESWLGIFTNTKTETIINNSQRKNIIQYQEMMEKSFKKYYELLKPGRWMTVEFSNSQASVWNAIQESIQRSGFIIANVAALDKKQGSFNAITSTTAVKQDLVISAYKPLEEDTEKIRAKADDIESVWVFIKQHLNKLPIILGNKEEIRIVTERTPRILFDRMIVYYVQNGFSIPISSADFQREVVQRFPLRDGMLFLEDQVAKYDKIRALTKALVQSTLFISDENSAIEWIRQQLMNKPQTRQDIHPNFMKEIQHIAKHELLPELDDLLEQNFLLYDGKEDVPSQIHGYLSSNYKDLRNLVKSDPRLKEKGKNRWYVPDPNKQADLEKLREKSLLREFEGYKTEIVGNKKKLKQFRTEAIRSGFKKAWSEKDFETIVIVGERLSEKIIQEDDKLLMYFDQAQIRLGM